MRWPNAIPLSLLGYGNMEMGFRRLKRRYKVCERDMHGTPYIIYTYPIWFQSFIQ